MRHNTEKTPHRTIDEENLAPTPVEEEIQEIKRQFEGIGNKRTTKKEEDVLDKLDFIKDQKVGERIAIKDAFKTEYFNEGDILFNYGKWPD